MLYPSWVTSQWCYMRKLKNNSLVGMYNYSQQYTLLYKQLHLHTSEGICIFGYIGYCKVLTTSLRNSLLCATSFVKSSIPLWSFEPFLLPSPFCVFSFSSLICFPQSLSLFLFSSLHLSLLFFLLHIHLSFPHYGFVASEHFFHLFIVL